MNENVYGNVTIADNDTQIKRLTTMHLKPLKKALKPFLRSDTLVEIALYPHEDTENEYALLFRDTSSKDPYTWLAVCPRIIIKELDVC